MDWAGLGVIIIGVALLGLVALLIKPLQSLTKALGNLEQTTRDLPAQVSGLMENITNTIHSAHNALDQVNEQLRSLLPIMQLIKQIGSSLQSLTTKIASINDEMRASATNPLMTRYHLDGLYGILALGYTILRRR